MFRCSRCQLETGRETCPECGRPTVRESPAEEKKLAKGWKLGFKREPEEPKWPVGPDGEPEKAAFLTHTSDFGGGGEMTEAMLRAYGIPVFSRYPGDGSFGRVMLGFSGYGRELFVPESRLELAQKLLSAPGAEPENPAEQEE